MTPGERVAAAARATVGVRFRLHGRDPAMGLDCVGVAERALSAAGCGACVPPDYAMASGRMPTGVRLAGLRACDGAKAGDVLVCRVSAAQLHLAVRTGEGIVHADAALRRVVERPGEPPWPIEAAWRVKGED